VYAAGRQLPFVLSSTQASFVYQVTIGDRTIAEVVLAMYSEFSAYTSSGPDC
jgi:hypothetical protein